MFGKKKANKTVDSSAASSDTSVKDGSGTLSGTTTKATAIAADHATGIAEKTEKRSEPQLFTRPRTKDEPQMSSKPHSTSFRPEIPKRPLEIPTRGNSRLDILDVASDPVKGAHGLVIINACAYGHGFLASNYLQESVEKFSGGGQDPCRGLISLLLLN